MDLIHIIILVVGLFAVSRAYLRMRESKISLGEFIFWFFLWLGAAIISFFPDILSYLSDRTGFGRGMDFLLAVSIIVLFYLLFRLYVKVDETNKEVTKLVREIAIMKKK